MNPLLHLILFMWKTLIENLWVHFFALMSSSILQSSRTRASRIYLSYQVLLISRNSQMDDEKFVIDWSVNMGSYHLLHFGIRWCLGATHQACSRRTLGRLSRDRHLCCCGCRHKLADFPGDGRNNNTPAAREVSCQKLEKISIDITQIPADPWQTACSLLDAAAAVVTDS